MKSTMTGDEQRDQTRPPLAFDLDDLKNQTLTLS